MSLLLLKTKDLSWQDHTMNVEVMLKPNQCQLLLNKHKTLHTKYMQARDLFEKQLQSYIKDYTLERRLTDRYREKLTSRKRELTQQRVQSAFEARQMAEVELQRIKSAPITKSKTPSPIRHIGKRSRGLFITEIDDDKIYRLPSISQKKDKKQAFFEGLSRPKSKPKQDEKQKTEPESLGEKRYITLPIKSEATLTAEKQAEEMQGALLEKVKSFVEEIREFNRKPPPHEESTSESLSSAKSRGITPLVAKRYSTFTVDMQKIETAFDDFCKTNSKEDLQKMMKLAAKLKSNVALARNQSLVPTIGAFKSSRAFKRLTKRYDSSQPCEGE
ncbi:uncharacterized protein LOC121382836 [Gigantopelta aegis]|uniref:uncharacterized protein LOC121382836 n=1 Tax=Gigantopelta aegis TaxID=1735272 RepID=UPI001B88D420|nr:uncharacterized protein LOC121382836 [Gigantopelta aegis]XP_041368396.1 uncharacterized protein LOC121382836 [Gigantopelta aegis]